MSSSFLVSSSSSPSSTDPPLTARRQSTSSYLTSVLKPMAAIKLWPSGPADQATPKASSHEKNPFDNLAAARPRKPSNNAASLLTGMQSPITPLASASGALTPNAAFSAALPTTQLSIHPPDFEIKQPPPPRRQEPVLHEQPPAQQASAPAQQPRSGRNSPSSSTKGQLHVKLIQARGLNVRSARARPYVVVQFEQSEFVSREPTSEAEKEVKGVPVVLSRNTSSTALGALGAITKSRPYELAASSRTRQPSTSSSANSTPPSTFIAGPVGSSSAAATVAATQNGLAALGRSAASPIWKHEVSFDVTSEDAANAISFNIYDRASEAEAFLGTLDIKPVFKHDHTVDQWYKLLPHESSPVTGEIRIQITYEQYKTRRSITPRDFEFLKLIGRGTFGRVFQVRKKDTKRIYAMKVLSKKEIVAKKEVAHTIGERKILQRSLESPFLVGLKFSFQTQTELYLVTDFKSGGELFWHLQRETRFTEDRARFYIAELILALEHLHKYDIVYRDLKPENILLDATGHVALCDFGLSKPDLPSDQLTNTFCGTTEYLAPEVLLDDQGYSKLVDFWSLGVLLFEMCCGWSPFYAEDTQQMYKNICFGRIRFPRGVINEDGKQFVKGLLNRNPKHRLGAQRDAEELKEHAFFKNIDWRALALKQVTPPFKPDVESDESTANFDPEFTSSDLRDVGVDILDDEDDPSEAWINSVSSSAHGHLPNGPLGSDGKANVQAIPSTRSRRKQEARGTPLTSSVQDNFRGFTFSGESVGMSQAASMLADRAFARGERVGDENAVDDEEFQDTNTEDEFEDDTTFGGRYARRNGVADDDD